MNFGATKLAMAYFYVEPPMALKRALQRALGHFEVALRIVAGRCPAADPVFAAVHCLKGALPQRSGVHVAQTRVATLVKRLGHPPKRTWNLKEGLC